MGGLPRPARIFWVGIVLAATIVAGGTIYRALDQPIAPITFLLFVAGGVLSQVFAVELPFSRTLNTRDVSLSTAAYVAALLVLPPGWAVLVGLLSFGIYALTQSDRPWFKIVFNGAQFCLALGLAGAVWHLPPGLVGPVDTPDKVLALVPALATYFVVNTASISMIFALAEGLPFWYVWATGVRKLVVAYVGMMFVGVLLAQLWFYNPLSLLLAVIPLVAIYDSFRTSAELEKQTVEALFEVADILDEREQYTYQHSRRVGSIAERIAASLGLPSEEVRLVAICGRLHDIGKAAISNDLLLKPSRLTPEEKEEINRHSAIGAGMLSHFSLFRRGSDFVRHHHEHFDGSGYPDRLRGEGIPLGARCILVADAYDAMTSDRVYRAALSQSEAVRRLKAGAGTQFDARCVDALVKILAEEAALGRHLPEFAVGSAETA